ncbi:unnamed protein product [Closterium sp. Yama58-4]|nr:unnamed protein product [Closterium sp. Yama58-4]
MNSSRKTASIFTLPHYRSAHSHDTEGQEYRSIPVNDDARFRSPVACLVQKSVSQKRTVAAHSAGLPLLRASRVTCSAERPHKKAALAISTTLLATATAALPSVAAVETILGGEGTGLPLGLSDNNFTWVVAGVFTGVWALFFVYQSKLADGDDDAGLGL